MLALALVALVASANDSGPASTDSTNSNSSNPHEPNNAMPALTPAGSSSTPGGRTLGIGLQLGYPTALTLKYMLQPNQGIVVGIGGFTGFDYTAAAVVLHVDYVYHPNLITAAEAYAVTWYVGAGGEILVFNSPRERAFLTGIVYSYSPTNVWLGARVPLGLNLALQQLPFEIYLEAAPELVVFPSISFGLGGAIGARGYF